MALSDEAFMQQLMATFAIEAQENLHVISQGLLILEDRERVAETGNLLAEMFRAAHSLKGAARAVGAEEIATLAHHLESRMGEVTNRRLYVLSLLSAIFLPLGFVTGLLGVNVGGIPGQHVSWGFWLLCGLFAMAVVGQLWMFRRWGWLGERPEQEPVRRRKAEED